MRHSFTVSLLVFVLLFSGCIQAPEKPEVVAKAATEEWEPDGIVGENEYTRSMVLTGISKSGYSGGEMEISWKSDQEYIYMALNGTTEGWLAVGFDPSEWMKDADMILGRVEGGVAIVLDEYSTGNYGPHLEDTMLGGRDDIALYGGRMDAGNTVVEFKRKLDTGDKFDRAMVPGESVSIIWAMSSSTDNSIKHDVAYGEGILPLVVEEGTVGVVAAALSPREEDGILFIWEEEKVARDLYTALYEETKLSIFMDLVRSEQNHMDQAKGIIDKYGLELPVEDEVGNFKNESLIRMYNDLLTRGKKSEEDALKVAATFEEISIVDLEKEISATESEDLLLVYQGLLAGSRKHLRSYVRDLQEQGIEYSPEYMSLQEYSETVK